MNISSLHIYPIKSCAGLDLDTVSVEPEGLSGDRRWMITDADGQFITQRSHPIMAQLSANIHAAGLTLSFAGDTLDVAYLKAERADVVVWRDDVNAAICGPDINQWLSDKLGEDVKLVYMDAPNLRMRPAFEQDELLSVSFADSYPVLITQTASLDALNDYVRAQGEAPLPMARFRPNIVIAGGSPWAMDGWSSLQIGDITFDLVKPCTRCVMTTLDPKTGESRGPAALDVLKALRVSGDKRVKGVLFGWNAVARNFGSLSIGDSVSVKQTRSPWPIIKKG